MRCSLAVLCLLLCSVVSAFGEADPHWARVKTDHFTVITDGSDRDARTTAGQLERMHAVFARLLPEAHDDPGANVIVFAFRDRKAFQALLPPAYLAKNSLELAGFFMPGQDRSYILLRLDHAGEHPYATVYHEYTHYMLRHLEVLPLWLNEGEAEFFQNTDIYDHDVRLGQPSVNDILFLREQTLLPLETIFTVDRDSPYYHEDGKGNIFYAESWALTHFLFLGDFGKPKSRLQIYFELLRKGETPLGAAEHAFGNLKILRAQLDDYIHHGEYSALRMPLGNLLTEKRLEVQGMAASDADALRADVLVRTGRLAEAETLARAVLAVAPGSAEAHETMGLLRLRQNDLPGAKKWYGEAVALHSSDFLAFYYFGSLSMQDGPAALPVATANLREALTLNPHFAPALQSLAECDAMQHDHLDEAVELSLRAVSADPGNIGYRLSASEIRIARKELPSALAILQAALKLAHTQGDRARIQDRIDQLQNFQEQAAALKAKRELTAASSGMASVNVASAETMVVTDRGGKRSRTYHLQDPDHRLPAGPAMGPHHTFSGTIHGASCFAPKGLQLKIETAGKALHLYSNDMYSIAYTAGNFTPEDELNPCLDFDGLKATVTYAPVQDPTEAGQIVAVELNK